MKRDIFFSEVTPLNFKTQKADPPPVLAIISIFEILIIACSTILLPSTQNTCEDFPLYLWLSVMIIVLNMHLILAGVENLCGKFGVVKGFGIAHGILLAGIISWLGFGHFTVFFQGIGCFQAQVFWVSSTLIGILDLLFLSTLAMVLHYYYRSN